MSALRRAAALLVASVFLAGIAACGEKPQRSVFEGSYNEQGSSPIAERTRNQNEAERIAY